MKRTESQMSDRRRKISYAIHQEPSSHRKKHRVPQVVGLAFFLVLGTVITVGLVFGIGPSNEGQNTTVQARVSGPDELVRAEWRGRRFREPTSRYSTISPATFNQIDELENQSEEFGNREARREFINKKESCVGKEGKYRFATVNSNSELCSNAGVALMARHHGSAVDVAIATMACIGVVNPQSSGLGGGFFMLVYKQGRVHALDARVTAPLRSTKDMYQQKPESAKQGHLSVATPGSVSGFWAAHQKFGILPWKDLFAPAIKLATDGFPVSQQLHVAIKSNRYKVERDPSLKGKFIDVQSGDAVRVGEIIDNAPLARTLALIAENGPEEFYNGSITRNLELDLLDVGGSLDTSDLLQYETKWRTPIRTQLRDTLSLHTIPPPGGGTLLTLVANIIDGYYQNMTVNDRGLVYHRLIEAIKFAMARKIELGDIDFSQTTLNDLHTKKYAEEIRDKITNMTHDDLSFYGNQTGVSDQGTGLVIVRNPGGDVVVATSSIGAAFGSGILGKFTGIIYNNGMADFDLPQTDSTSPNSNYIQPLKRARSSMSPCLVLDSSGDVVLALAAGGGTSGLSAQAFTILRTLYLEENLKTAIDSPFLHNGWQPPFTRYERTLDKSLITELRRRGHVMSKSQSTAFVHGIQMKHQFLHSYADRRKGGCVDGY